MNQALVIGSTVAVASTMVLARVLQDRGEMGTAHGTVMIGITLFEDLAVVFITVALPAFAGTEADRYSKAAWSLGKAVLFLIPLAILARTVIPRILRRVQGTKDEELFLLSALAICLGTAAVSHWAGLTKPQITAIPRVDAAMLHSVSRLRRTKAGISTRSRGG